MKFVFYAQLREVIPSVVVERNGRLQIKPTGLTAFLAKALQVIDAAIQY